jgi:hypothetical protein
LRVGGSQTKADCHASRHRFMRRSIGTNHPIRSPRLTWSETSSKRARLAKDSESCETVSIAESAQCSLIRCPAQLVSRDQTSLYAKVEIFLSGNSRKFSDHGPTMGFDDLPADERNARLHCLVRAHVPKPLSEVRRRFRSPLVRAFLFSRPVIAAQETSVFESSLQ